MAVDGAGNVIATGFSLGSGVDFYTAKYSGVDGSLIWEQREDRNAGNELSYAVAVDSAGNAFVTGRSGTDVYTVKYAATDGHALWRVAYGRGKDQGQAIAVDPDGNAVVLAISQGTASVSDFYTVKYAAGDGHILWEHRFDGPGAADDNPFDLAIDKAGNVVVTGNSRNSSGSLDLYTAKYASADGKLLWEKFYDGPAGKEDSGTAIALDAGGNVAITGYSVAQLRPDIYTAKYASSDGALLWEQRYNGPGNGNDFGNAIAADAAGNVIVAGTSVQSSKDSDYYVAKYAASDGQLLWDKNYAGFAGASEDARAIALTANGDAIVTGNGPNGSGDLEITTVKFAGTDGAIQFVKRLPGFTAVFGSKPLAVTPDGGAVVTGTTSGAINAFFTTVKYAPSGQLLNISTRLRVEKGDNALIGGFIVSGATSKKVLIRAIGPSLPFTDKLANPILELHESDGTIVSNDDWKKSADPAVSDADQQTAIQATTIPPTNDLESSLVQSLQPGAHTAIVRGLGESTGIGLVEAYDLDQAAPATLANISTRGLVQTGNNVMIGGFIVGGTQSVRVLLRGIGPSLTDSGVTGALADPTLDLVDKDGNVTTNDNWRSTQEADIQATTIPPKNDKESGIVATLAPGPYTAILRGKNSTTGVALVEAYDLQ